MINSFKDLIVWQKSLELTKEIYSLTRAFPQEELYNLTSQMRRAVLSIPSNIAEGYCRRGKKEYMQFLGISSGSAAELETQLIVAKEIYPQFDYEKAESLLQEVRKMLFALLKNLSA